MILIIHYLRIKKKLKLFINPIVNCTLVFDLLKDAIFQLKLNKKKRKNTK